ncbi:hypothetical protein DFH06DRAFT_1316415 [Mycena polygramma]|nr:hypothetical protein DFH06DRAFT_1316415 [Mycena polygramma]
MSMNVDDCIDISINVDGFGAPSKVKGLLSNKGLHRRRTLPLYRHPVLVPRDQARGKYIEPADGSITDGDDHAWSANPEMLAGGGGWRDLDFSSASLLGKRSRTARESDDGSSAADAEEIQRQHFPSLNGHEDDTEELIDGYATELLNCADDLEKAAAILRAQVPHRNRLWLSSIVKQDIGGDVTQMVADIHRFETTSRVRDTTWPQDKKERRRTQNTMGYQIPMDIDTPTDT